MSVSWRKESVYRDGSLNYGRIALYAIMIFVAIVWGAPLYLDVCHLHQAG